MAKNLATWNDFQAELSAQEASIVAMLPRHVPKDRFINSAIAAVKQTPGLLKCTPRSLFTSITKSAQDGLLPDGREGVITPYKEKDGDAWVEKAQWNPMAFGLRKRARELDHVIVDAQVVHENDEFEWDQGDEPKLIHKPAKLGTPRGALVGAYAIYKNDTGILHREVMDSDAIEKVRSQSKSPNGVMWAKFTAEAWRKTVVRRGFKSVPCSEPLQNIIQRDDETFAFDDAPQIAGKSRAGGRTVIQSSAEGERKALPPVVGENQAIEMFDSDGVIETVPADSIPEERPQELPPSRKKSKPLSEMLANTSSKPLPPTIFDSPEWAENCMRALRNADDPEEVAKIEMKMIIPHLTEASPVDADEVRVVLKEVKELAGMADVP